MLLLLRKSSNKDITEIFEEAEGVEFLDEDGKLQWIEFIYMIALHFCVSNLLTKYAVD